MPHHHYHYIILDLYQHQQLHEHLGPDFDHPTDDNHYKHDDIDHQHDSPACYEHVHDKHHAVDHHLTAPDDHPDQRHIDHGHYGATRGDDDHHPGDDAAAHCLS